VNGSVCVECLDVYKALKSKFKVAMEISNEEVCMDLVDMVGKFSYRCILVHCTDILCYYEKKV
jgi:hypothetical protein